MLYSKVKLNTVNQLQLKKKAAALSEDEGGGAKQRETQGRESRRALGVLHRRAPEPEILGGELRG